MSDGLDLCIVDGALRGKDGAQPDDSLIGRHCRNPLSETHGFVCALHISSFRGVVALPTMTEAAGAGNGLSRGGLSA